MQSDEEGDPLSGLYRPLAHARHVAEEVAATVVL
jgi:hypothetical protein